jgi:hypothetical protein
MKKLLHVAAFAFGVFCGWFARQHNDAAGSSGKGIEMISNTFNGDGVSWRKPSAHWDTNYIRAIAGIRPPLAHDDWNRQQHVVNLIYGWNRTTGITQSGMPYISSFPNKYYPPLAKQMEQWKGAITLE